MQNHSGRRSPHELKITSHIPDRHVLGSGKAYLQQSIKNSPYSIIEEEKVGDAIHLASTPRVETPPSPPQSHISSRHKRISKDKTYKRQEKSLQIYEQKQKEWDKISNRLAKRFGRDTSSLVMERSGVEYRTKMEEIDMFEAAVPVSQRHNNSSWEMSLRNGDSSGVRYVKVGGSWPYPLYCPVIQKPPSLPSTVRNPFKGQLLNERSVLGIRNLKSEYVREKYGKYIKKLKVIHDPIEEIGELKLIGRTIGDPDFQDRREYAFDTDEFNVDVDELDKDIQQMENQAESRGPEFSLSSNSLIFETAPSQLSQASITLKNSGTCVLQYSWEQAPYIDDLQRTRSWTKFQLATESRGTILPNSSKTFLFSFQSDIEGIFTDGYRLDTIPRIEHQKCDPHLRLRGISIVGERKSKAHEFDEYERDLMSRNQLEDNHSTNIHTVENIISDQNTRDYSFEHQQRLLETFVEKNQHLFPNTLIVSTEMFSALQLLALNIIAEKRQDSTPDTWDLSLSSLKLVLHQIPDERTREHLAKIMMDFEKVLGCVSSNNVESLQSRLYYSICYEQVLDAVDQIVDTAIYLEERFLTEDPSKKKANGVIAAKKGVKSSGSRPSSRQGESDNQVTLKERYGKDLREQSSMILCNTLDRIENMWHDSLTRTENLGERISKTT